VLHKGRVLATGRSSEIVARQGARNLLGAFESLIGEAQGEEAHG
jgi:ABC-type Na+ transport system ATPase subunit NatA